MVSSEAPSSGPASLVNSGGVEGVEEVHDSAVRIAPWPKQLVALTLCTLRSAPLRSEASSAHHFPGHRSCEALGPCARPRRPGRSPRPAAARGPLQALHDAGSGAIAELGSGASEEQPEEPGGGKLEMSEGILFDYVFEGFSIFDIFWQQLLEKGSKRGFAVTLLLLRLGIFYTGLPDLSGKGISLEEFGLEGFCHATFRV